MIAKVVCINDKKLPPDGQLVKGNEYVVVEKFVNGYDQIVYIIEGITNEGRTRFGLPWIGYNSTRFETMSEITLEEVEELFELNTN
jgi:hypothetical protein